MVPSGRRRAALPAGQLRVATAVAMLEVLEVHLDDLRRRLAYRRQTQPRPPVPPVLRC